MALHNRVDKRVLKEQLKQITYPRKTLSYYRYRQIEDPSAFRDQLYKMLDNLDVWGRIYVASEGINGQISVPSHFYNDFKATLYSIPLLEGVRLNEAIDDDGKSFFKLKILVRSKIVADGLDDKSFDVTNSGKHLNAPEFNTLTSDPNTIVVDMRNHYESEIGHFKSAILPDADTFREALPIVEKILKGKTENNIVMYCTGGIRCEKASAWFKHKGFKNVYQLNGGIIEYARQVKQGGLDNRFVGKNFVFDERLGERISDDIISVCHQCGNSCDTHTNCKNNGCHLLFIQCEVCAAKYDGCCSYECSKIFPLQEEKQRALRKGVNKGRQIFKKGRSEKIIFKVNKS